MSQDAIKLALDEMENDDVGRAWVVTFADMMTLILVFFILLYTLSQLEHEDFQTKISKVNVVDVDGNQISVIDYATNESRNPNPVRLIEDVLGLNPSPNTVVTHNPRAEKALQGMIESSDLSDSVDMAVEGNVITISIDGRFVFDSAKADLTEDAYIIFSKLTQFFNEHEDYTIAIKGHTDDLIIDTKEFPSNWELSAVRATSVLRYFIAQGIDPERMTATGYADFLPIVPNNSSENRAKNRRVEFVLEQEKNR